MVDVATLGIRVESDGALKASADLNRLETQAGKAEAATTKLGRASKTAGAGMATGARHVRTVDTAMQGAGGSTANLAAQFNDIGVMLAAGQSPLLLAMQQGTQVNQVLGTMGTSGAARVAALKTAFLSVVSPANLMTLGIIAGGAALAQWAMSALSAEDNADDLADAIESLGDEASDARDKVELFNRGLENTAQLQVLDAIAQKEAEIAAAQSAMETLSGRNAGGARQRLINLQAELEIMREQVSERNAAVAAAERLERIQEQANAAGAEYFRQVALQEKANEEAEQMLSTLIEQNNIQAAINRYGEESAQVSQLRAAAERDAFDEMLSTLDVSQDLKDELTGAFLVSQDLANSDMSPGIISAAQAARDLAAELQVSLNIANSLANMTDAARSGVSGPDGAIQQVRGAREDAIVFQRTYPSVNSRAAAGRRSGGGGGGGGLSDAQREAERQRNEDLRAAENIMNDLMTAQDIYNDALDQANRLHSAGVLPLSAYTEHVAQLRQQLIDTQWEDSGFGIIVDDMTEALSTASSLGEAFDNLGDVFISNIRRMAAAQINSGLTMLGQALLGGFGGFGGGAGIATPSFTGLYDAGGTIPRGGFGIVGERGPELVSGPANVTSRVDTARMMGGGDTHYNIDARGAQQGVAEQIVNALKAYDQRLPSRMRQLQANPDRDY